MLIESLEDLLGTFWSKYYGGADQVRAHLRGISELTRQNVQNLQEAVAAESRLSAPLLHTERWQRLRLLESDGRQSSQLHYGAGGSYGGGRQYGVPATRMGVSFHVPDLVEAPLIVDKMRHPTKVWLPKVDFWLFDGRIWFPEDPFQRDGAEIDTITQGGAALDRELSLWVLRGGLDREYLYRGHGVLLDFRHPSTPAYKLAVNAALDAVVGGTAERQVRELLSALLDIPLVRHAEETVVDVALDGRQLIIATNLEVYLFPMAAIPSVTSGDLLHRGDSLIEGLRFDYLNRGQLPADLPGISIGAGLLAPGYVGDLFFPAREVPLMVDRQDGWTRVRFELGGHPADIEEFWRVVHTRGIQMGRTLAQMLDTSVDPDGSDPTAAALPTTINPAAFLVSTLLRHNAWMVRISADSQGGGAMGLRHSRLLRTVVPPHKLLFWSITLPTLRDSFGSNLESLDDPQLWCEPFSDIWDGVLGLPGLMIEVLGRCTEPHNTVVV